MPQQIFQGAKKRSDRVVRISYVSAEERNAVNSLIIFVFREFAHWKKDLQNRKKEGKYYLDLLPWVEVITAEPPGSDAFLQLLHLEIPSFNRAIEKLNRTSTDLNMERIRSMQKNYFQLCERYDQIKMLIIVQLEGGRRFDIY